jgi:predicted transposase YbfD/YdcC
MEADASLMEVLEGIYDPRNARGKRHPLPALLALAVVAMLAGMTSYEAIVDYGKERGGEFLRLLGFTRRRGLCKATYSRVFRRIDVADFESRVGQWIRGQLGPRDASHLAIDGKTARGSRDGETPGIHLVSAYAPDVKAVVGQLRVDAKTNEHKAALELLGVLSVKGRVISGDAMFTHRDVCAKVIEGGGDYIFPVKENQPTLRADIAAAFAQPDAGLSPLQTARAEAEVDRACEVDKGHGRIEKRTIEVTSSLAGYLGSDWPGCEQVFRLTRERTIKGKTETEVVFGITSLLPERAGVKGLLGLTRGHWGIENGLHGVRDGTLREDASRIRKGSGPEVMAALRNIVIFLFNRLGHKSAAAATRHYVCHPQKSLELLSTPIRE